MDRHKWKLEIFKNVCGTNEEQEIITVAATLH